MQEWKRDVMVRCGWVTLGSYHCITWIVAIVNYDIFAAFI